MTQFSCPPLQKTCSTCSEPLQCSLCTSAPCWPPCGDCSSPQDWTPMRAELPPNLFQNSQCWYITRLKVPAKPAPLALRREMVFVVKTKEKEGKIQIQLIFLACSPSMCLPWTGVCLLRELIWFRWREWGTERLSNLPQVTQLSSCRSESHARVCLCLLALKFLPL